jgi:ABC-2 type transport system permease protein
MALVLRHYYLIRGSVSRILPLFVWVTIDILLWGFITRYLGTITVPGTDFVVTLLGAVLLWDFFSRVMHGVAMAFLEDVWSRNFLNVFATPISISEYLGGLVLSSVASSALGLAVMLILAGGLFGFSITVYGILVIPFLFVLFLFGIALGIFGVAVVLRFGPAAEWFIWPVPAIVSPFAGVFYPIETLPRWMQAIAHVLPPAYVFEGIRAIAGRGAMRPGTLAWAAALALLDIVLACWFFQRVHRHAVRSGLIARYSAETVN